MVHHMSSSPGGCLECHELPLLTSSAYPGLLLGTPEILSFGAPRGLHPEAQSNL